MQGALPTGLRKASGGGCWSLVPAGQSERVRSPHPLCRPAFRTQTTWPPQKRREGARVEKVYLLTRVQLRHCVPKARRQPKPLCSPRRGTATDVALLALRSTRPSSLANAGHREASFAPLPLMRLTHPGQEHGSQGMPALLKCSDSSSQAQPSRTSLVSEMMSLQGGPYKTPPLSFLHSWANNGQETPNVTGHHVSQQHSASSRAGPLMSH